MEQHRSRQPAGHDLRTGRPELYSAGLPHPARPGKHLRHRQMVVCRNINNQYSLILSTDLERVGQARPTSSVRKCPSLPPCCSSSVLRVLMYSAAGSQNPSRPFPAPRGRWHAAITRCASRPRRMTSWRVGRGFQHHGPGGGPHLGAAAGPHRQCQPRPAHAADAHQGLCRDGTRPDGRQQGKAGRTAPRSSWTRPTASPAL